jgi:superfamily II DNA or RNA helicase
MPRIFDNIENELKPALEQTLLASQRADFCVGYFNLRGWKEIDACIEQWPGGDGHQCRLLVGMQRLPQDELRELLSMVKRDGTVDNQTALRLKKGLAEEFKMQLTFGVPSERDEAGLRRLAAQLKSKKLAVKLFLRHSLHAKLYLCFREDFNNPRVGYIGSSNLTLSGLSHQGELNVDVLHHDATDKLAKWFEARWTDKWCLDISAELIQVIEQSWAREVLIPPYHIYVKIAYHLAQEARAGLSEFHIPSEFGNRLFEYQVAAVKIAAHHLNKRGGVLIGDVVGLGKTIMATALARIFQDDQYTETLIISPKNLVSMWEDYVAQYRLLAKVISATRVQHELPNLRRYRVVLIDESHNLRSREGKRYRIIRDYIERNDSKCILLTATPYNKTYLDLSNQLRLFVEEDKDLGVRPERLLKDLGETEFIRRHQCAVKSLAAFEKSTYPDDWRELMRLYMVRRTRSFIENNYARTNAESGRKFLTFEDGTPFYFPKRLPRTVKFKIKDNDPDDQYARLYAGAVVDSIRMLTLPRYGLGNYVAASPSKAPTQAEADAIQDLSRAGRRLMGFCRTNLFKRLESCGKAFLLSVERHILRNYIYLHAIENNKPLPIGTQEPGLLDTRLDDQDNDQTTTGDDFFSEDDTTASDEGDVGSLRAPADYKARAAVVYGQYTTHFKSRFKWLRPDLFVPDLARDLRRDAGELFKVLDRAGEWRPEKDAKVDALEKLLAKTHAKEKVIVFSQFADTVSYLEEELQRRGLKRLAGVTGNADDPTSFAWRFSPESNRKRATIPPEEEIRVLIATDVLSEGQNLQDGAIVVNFDLPWAIIRLIQRAGRVDRIGQRSENILCYSFLPADGVERIIRLRSRVRQRLHENAEVVGTDESFFEDEKHDEVIRDLFTEKAGILDDPEDNEVDLASLAYQIWKNAIERDPALQKSIPELPNLVYSTKALSALSPQISARKPGVLAYLRTAADNDALAWLDLDGAMVTESQFEILKAAECAPDTPALPRQETHHTLVRKAVEAIVRQEKDVGGSLGRPSGARFRTYERLKRYAERVKGTLFDTDQLRKTVEDIYRYPLRQVAIDTLNCQLRLGINDDQLAELAVALREEDRLCLVHEEEEAREPQIICSLGLAPQEAAP